MTERKVHFRNGMFLVGTKEEIMDEAIERQAKDRKKLSQPHSVSGSRRDHSHDVDSALTDHVPRKGKGRVRPASKKEMRVSAMRDAGIKQEEVVKEVAPPGWGHTKAEKEKTDPSKPKSKIGGTIAAMKRAQERGDIPKKLNIFALAYSMKNKGAKPHYKPGTDEKYKKYQDKDNGVSEEMENVPPRDKAKIKARFKTLHKRDLKGTLPEAKRKPLKGDPIELGGGFQGTLPEGKSWKDFKRAITAVKKGKEQKKPEKAMDAGARAKRVLARKEYAAKVSGSTENVPDDIRD